MAALLLATAPSHANRDAEARAQSLAAELRCPVCRNQSLADSDAPMAADLRGEIRRQVAEGRSDAEVRQFMVERYGDAVSYRPPLAPQTAPLWLAPFVVLAGAAALLGWRVARRWRQAGTGIKGTVR